jgi:Tol biopolymer transport system component
MSKYIAFQNTTGLISLDLETQEAKVFRNTPSSFSPAWNPTGKKLVVGKNNIYVLDIESSKIDTLLTKPDQDAIFPAWHPSLPIIAFSIRTDKGWMIQFCNLDNDTHWLLPLDIQAFQIDWHPNGEQIAFVGITPKGKHIFIADIGAYLRYRVDKRMSRGTLKCI